MKPQSQQLWSILLASNVVTGEMSETSEKLESPWYVKVLLGVSGWIASLCLFVFMGFLLFDIIDNSSTGFFIGSVVIGAGYALLRSSKNEFVENLALASCLAGQGLMVFSIYEFAHHDELLFWQLVVLLQIVLVAIIPSFIHRVLATIAATISYSIMMNKMGLPGLVTGTVLLFATLCWLNEFRFSKYMSTFRAIGYGLVLAMLVFEGGGTYSFITQDFLDLYSYTEVILSPWIGNALVSAVIMYLVWNILQRYHEEMFEIIPAAALFASLLLCVASMEMPGLNVGIAILLLSFLGSNRILMGLATVLILFYISSYYYFLNATLFEKSQSLLVIGISLLIMRWFMHNILTRKKGAEHA